MFKSSRVPSHSLLSPSLRHNESTICPGSTQRQLIFYIIRVLVVDLYSQIPFLPFSLGFPPSSNIPLLSLTDKRFTRSFFFRTLVVQDLDFLLRDLIVLIPPLFNVGKSQRSLRRNLSPTSLPNSQFSVGDWTTHWDPFSKRERPGNRKVYLFITQSDLNKQNFYELHIQTPFTYVYIYIYFIRNRSFTNVRKTSLSIFDLCYYVLFRVNLEFPCLRRLTLLPFRKYLLHNYTQNFLLILQSVELSSSSQGSRFHDSLYILEKFTGTLSVKFKHQDPMKVLGSPPIK